MKLPAASGRGIKTDKNLIILGGTRGFPPNPSSACLPHRKRMGYSKDHNKSPSADIWFLPYDITAYQNPQ